MKHVVVIGSGAAAVSAVCRMRELAPALRITLISEERHIGYDRRRLAEVLMRGARYRDIALQPAAFWQQERLTTRGGTVERIAVRRNTAMLRDKTKLSYDACLIATGMDARPPRQIKGAQYHGIFSFRKWQHISDITALLPITGTVCVLEPSIAGLSAAVMFRRRGLDVKIISAAPHLLSHMLDPAAAAVVAEALCGQGIELIAESGIEEIYGDGDVKAVQVSSGKIIGCGMIITDCWHQPRSDFILPACAGQQPAIPVDNSLRFGQECIFAAGDVAAVSAEQHQGGWGRAEAQGAIAANNIVRLLGEDVALSEYHGAENLWQCAVGEVALLVWEKLPPVASTVVPEVVCEQRTGYYRRVDSVDGKPVRVIQCGSAGEIAAFRQELTPTVEVMCGSGS